MSKREERPELNGTLDPDDWGQMEELSVQMVRDMFYFMRTIRERPVWIQPTEKAKTAIGLSGFGKAPSVQDSYENFKENILPFVKGSGHGAYWSWVEGGGTPLGMMGEMLAAGMNSNSNNGDHMAMYVDQEVARWLRDALQLDASGTVSFVSGGSMANLSALTVARNEFLGKDTRTKGVWSGAPLIIYTSVETHSCVQKSIEVLGIGNEHVQYVPVDAKYRMDVAALRKQIEQDKEAGFRPWCVAANCGTVKTGAIDPLKEIAQVCKEFEMWFHVDGAFGAFARLLPEYDEQVAGLELADSVAFDLHKWMYIPYELACVYVKKSELLKESFGIESDYLTVHDRGLAAGPEPLSNLGLEMSRGFRSLKVWFSIQEHGLEGYTAMIRKNIAQAAYLASLIKAERDLELLAEVNLNLVCFRYNPADRALDNDTLNKMNKELVMRLHERGNVAPSYTVLDGKYAIRAAMVNHRSEQRDFDRLMVEVLNLGKEQG